MDEIGFMGTVALGGTFTPGVVWRNGSWVPTTPTGTPTYTIYSNDFSSSVATGSMDAADQDSKTGLRSASITCSGPTYASGTLYTIIFEGTVTAVAHTQKGTFLVD